jgi:hypothetical protein
MQNNESETGIQEEFLPEKTYKERILKQTGCD